MSLTSIHHSISQLAIRKTLENTIWKVISIRKSNSKFLSSVKKNRIYTTSPQNVAYAGWN